MAIFSIVPSGCAKKHANKHYERNTAHSPLCVLPYELVKEIGSHCQHVDRVCFALSSIKYLKAIQPLHPTTIPDPRYRLKIRGRLKRNDFYRWRRYLVNLGGFRRVIWCASCAEWHRDTPVVFPSNTITLHRKDRWCHKSIAGQLVICQHHQLYFEGLVQLLRLANYTNGSWISYGGF
jgi:hypothetical protein